MDDTSLSDVLLDQETRLSAQLTFADLHPLRVEEGTAVAYIEYEDRQWDVLSLFRRILEKGETSMRALELTQHVIGINQAEYTAWEWRWRCLLANHVDLATEYAFTDSIMQDNAKNYQLWNHRRKCALALGAAAAARELEAADEALRTDAKNYHAWAHRQAIVQTYGGRLWAEELLYSDSHIQEDVRNNSAWNQRAFIIRRDAEQLSTAEPPDDAISSDPLTAAGRPAAEIGGSPPGAISSGRDAMMDIRLVRLLEREINYVAAQVARAPRNESSWNYLTGLFRLPGVPPDAMGLFDEVHVICTEALQDGPSSPCALDVLAQYFAHVAALELRRLRLSADAAAVQQQTPEQVSACEATSKALDTCVNYVMVLLETLVIADPIRIMYWRQRQQSIQALLHAAQGLVQPIQQTGAPQHS